MDRAVVQNTQAYTPPFYSTALTHSATYTLDFQLQDKRGGLVILAPEIINLAGQQRGQTGRLEEVTFVLGL